MGNGVDFKVMAIGLRAELTAAQSELTALREELESERTLRRNHAARIHELSDQTKDIQQRLAAADQRNAAMANLLRRSVADRDQPYKQWWNERAKLLLECMKPTESGASECSTN